MKDIPRLRGRKYIASLVAQGEHECQDFKFTVSDARKIAHSVSAFSNAGGGRLLIGVKDNGVVAGVRNEEDIYVVEQAARLYCRPSVEVEFTAFSYDTNIVVIRAEIPKAASRPVRCQHPDGSWKAYYRVGDENILAHPLMVRAWLAPRAGFSLTDDVAALLHVLDSHPQGLDVAAIARLLSISERLAEQHIVALAAAGVVGFTYRAPHFLITRLPA